MKYAYEDMSTEQFEKLVVYICREILGMGTREFCTGPDGGRDALFHGIAEIYPSSQSPWNGKIVVQAKHTSGINEKFSDKQFFSTGNLSSVILKEEPRIKKLKEEGDLDYYLLFSNRRLSGNIDTEISKYIADKCVVPEQNIRFIGIDEIESWLKRFPHIPQMVNIDPIDSPLKIDPVDLAELILKLKENIDVFEMPSDLELDRIQRIEFSDKNRINGLSHEYGELIKSEYLPYAIHFRKFLEASMNSDICEIYEEIVFDFQINIIAKRKDYQSFDEVLNYIIALLFSRDVDLRSNKKLTRFIVYYMYWNCDIGTEEEMYDVEAK